MYKESYQNHEAMKIYNELYEQIDSLRSSYICRLAMGYIGLANFEKARACLDKASDRSQNDPMYLHYEGIYHLKMNNLGVSFMSEKKLKSRTSLDERSLKFAYT